MKKTVLLIAILIFTILSCELLEIESGMAFEHNNLLDYNNRDVIKYTNGIDTINFNVVNAESRESSISNGTGRMKLTTDKQGDYTISEQTNQDDSYIDYLRMSLTGKVDETIYNLVINLENKSSHTIDRCIVEYYQDYNFKGKNYRDVFEVSYDTLSYNFSKPKVPFVTRAIPGGILKFYDSETKQMWELIE